MNENIDLTKILKDCPKGTKLYTPLYGEVEFCGIEDNRIWPIWVKFHNDDSPEISGFMEDGRHYNYPYGECLLFPSKDQRDWSKFKPKKPKFDPKTLQPFDRVLARDYDTCKWRADFYSHKEEGNRFPYICMGNNLYKQCIPYNDDTKHLVGTNKEAPEYYRYWED